MMALMSVRLGSNNVEKAGAFYDSTFKTIGFGDIRMPTSSGVALYALPGDPYLITRSAYAGEAATPANGGTIGFAAPDAAAVDRWHATGLTSGGTCEGARGTRAAAGGRYGAYLRDPDGNKLCA
ncbi:VOC family protein [Sphingobium tyrosinilyticum]|uniref:VOC family protein n=1 Tax=Sphingobium tyrosinilyticum TaxID=2715436 RepID=A0ABV9F494_9SPHN